MKEIREQYELQFLKLLAKGMKLRLEKKHSEANTTHDRNQSLHTPRTPKTG
ncbi:hypothetical protein ERICV_01719 [Paenibacillus larvae subsp. larvae]|uniref:Uncharacterized protein n=1 Tax=Paenibacillus larvae subsp. larvae TaxID=147375 RepID=A0A6C0QQ84_9BACL|nr:hypothetical protein ERICV_01719 [Paenibacillus larvae subsp. larvae]